MLLTKRCIMYRKCWSTCTFTSSDYIYYYYINKFIIEHHIHRITHHIHIHIHTPHTHTHTHHIHTSHTLHTHTHTTYTHHTHYNTAHITLTTHTTKPKPSVITYVAIPTWWDISTRHWESAQANSGLVKVRTPKTLDAVFLLFFFYNQEYTLLSNLNHILILNHAVKL